MKITLLILSTILLHLPLSAIKETIRRRDRMGTLNPEDAIVYEAENGSIPNLSSLGVIGYACSLLLALIPLFLTFQTHWFILIIANSLFSFIGAPLIMYLIYPIGSIYTRGRLKIITTMYVMIGVLSFMIAICI